MEAIFTYLSRSDITVAEARIMFAEMVGMTHFEARSRRNTTV